MTDTADTLRFVTDQALDEAHTALTEGWRRVSATDIGGGAADVVGAEMGALTLPLGTITRIRRRRRRDGGRVLDRINDYDAEAREREEQAEGARQHRDDAIREALDGGTSAAQIADVLDMHVQRIYQIKRGER